MNGCRCRGPRSVGASCCTPEGSPCRWARSSRRAARTGRAAPNPAASANAPDVSPLVEGEVDDVVLLRTAQSLEYTAIDAYAAARALDVLSAEQDTLVQRFVDDHTGHSVALGGFITAAGGEEFACANPWMQRRVIDPIFDAIDGSDDMLRDVLNFVQALESLAGASYQSLVGSLTEPDLRMKMMQIGADENRHAATIGDRRSPAHPTGT